MTYVITGTCCNDASCVPVCPVDCIHPRPDEPDFGQAEMLYIDPESCIDCSACVDVCPVGAIVSEDELTQATAPFLDVATKHFARPTWDDQELSEEPVRTSTNRRADFSGLRVAVVGSGPAGGYAAASLLEHRGVEVDVYDRTLTPHGLVRFGVAPDHVSTKQVTSVFPFGNSRCQLHLGVEVGRDITHDELLAHHHAVIYAVGADVDRRLGIPGEDLPGSHSATEFVAWYNGHPDYADRVYDLSGPRAVVIGNGNVALDVARVLVTDPDELARTDIADHALEALRHSAVEEVVILGRRGPAHAAYSYPELLGLTHVPGVEIRAVPDEVELDDVTHRAFESRVPLGVELKVELARLAAQAVPRAGSRLITLRFLASPVEILGSERVAGIRVARNRLSEGADGQLSGEPSDDSAVIETNLVLRSIGYRSSPVAGLPFDDLRGVIPNEDGRVVDATSRPVPGAYVAGWAGHGPRGVIGTNRTSSAATVDAVLADFLEGRLVAPGKDAEELRLLLVERCEDLIGTDGWRRVDSAERAAGTTSGRPRVKLTSNAAILAAASEQVSSPS